MIRNVDCRKGRWANKPDLRLRAEKRCPICTLVRNPSDFYRCSTRYDGLAAICKSCMSATTDVSKARIRSHASYERNKQEHQARSKRWCMANPERIRASKKRHYANHAEAEKARYREWRLADPAKARIRNIRRRAVQKGAIGSHTVNEWKFLVALLDHRCVYCQLQFANLTEDHVIPLSKGGTDYIENILPACRSCNSSKRDRLLSWSEM